MQAVYEALDRAVLANELDKKLHTIQLHLGCHAQEPIFITDLNVGKDPDRAAGIQAAAPGLCSASGAVQPNSGQTSPIHAAQQVEVGHMHEMVRLLGKMHVDMQKMSAKIDKQTAELNELKMSSPQTRRLSSPSDVVVVGKENGNASSSSRSLSRLAQADALAAGIRKARLAAGSQPPAVLATSGDGVGNSGQGRASCQSRRHPTPDTA